MLANRVVTPVLLAAVLAGCGGSAAEHPDTLKPSSGQPPSGDPAELVGQWFVAADGEEPHAILTIGNRVDGGLLLYRECGTLFGDWRANTYAMFVGDIDGGSGDCFENQRRPLPTWMAMVTSFRRDGDTELLIGADGETVATLTPGAHPSPRPDSVAEYASPPVVTDSMRAKFAEPRPLPSDVSPAARGDVIGRWLPLPKERPQQSPDAAYVAFDADGTYKGSDGCNGDGGRWALGPDGVILATSGASTAIGCDTSPLSGWPPQAGRLGLRAGHLVFVDPAGKILGEAVRA